MIIIDEINFSKEIKILHNSEFQFYLTGSRFFGNYRDESDHDFFTKCSVQVKMFLTTNGFVELSSYGDYGALDNNTVCVFRKNKVDVQLSSNLELKKVCQDIIKEFNLLSGVKKRDHHLVWNKLSSIISNGVSNCRTVI